MAWSWHLVEGRAWRHACVLHCVLQRLPGRQRSKPHGACECANAWNERAPIDAPRLLAVGTVVDVFLAAYLGWICRGGRRGRRISRCGGRAWLSHPAGGGRLRRCWRFFRDVRPGGLCDRDRCLCQRNREAPAGLAACRQRKPPLVIVLLLAYRPLASGLKKPRVIREDTDVRTLYPAVRCHIGRAPAFERNGARAIQSDARRRRRIVPVLSAHHAGAGA